jgi:hypothetical protein
MLCIKSKISFGFVVVCSKAKDFLSKLSELKVEFFFSQDGWTVLIFRFYKFRLAFAGIIVEEFCKSAEHIWK